MIRNTLIATALLLSPVTLVAAEDAPAEAPAKTAKYSIDQTPIGTLLDTPATKAILDKHLPGFSSNSQVEMARGMTLKQVQPFAGGMISDEALAKIDADLAVVE